LARPSSSNPAAEDVFLRGKYLASRDDKGQQTQGLTLLERAVELDPGFAAGYAALARAYTNHYFDTNPAARPELEPKAFAAVERAMSLNPNLADAYVARALGLDSFNGFPHQRAIQDLRRAIKSRPRLKRGESWLGLLPRRIAGARIGGSAEERRAGTQSDGGQLQRPGSSGGTRPCLASMGRHEQALEEWGRSAPMTMHPFNAMNMAWSLVTVGRIPEARTLVEDLSARVGPANENSAAAQAILLAVEGQRKPAQQQIAIALSKESRTRRPLPPSLSSRHASMHASGTPTTRCAG
jgi:tetratricopeptide (TPR) repeat protein